jgi:hypothetical protein
MISRCKPLTRITFGVLYRYQTEAQIVVLCLIEMLNSDSTTFGVLYRYQREADPCIVFNRVVTEARYLNALLTRTAVVFAI